MKRSSELDMLSPTPFESVDTHRRGFIRAAAAATLIPESFQVPPVNIP